MTCKHNLKKKEINTQAYQLSYHHYATISLLPLCPISPIPTVGQAISQRFECASVCRPLRILLTWCLWLPTNGQLPNSHPIHPEQMLYAEPQLSWAWGKTVRIFKFRRRLVLFVCSTTVRGTRSSYYYWNILKFTLYLSAVCACAGCLARVSVPPLSTKEWHAHPPLLLVWPILPLIPAWRAACVVRHSVI